MNNECPPRSPPDPQSNATSRKNPENSEASLLVPRGTQVQSCAARKSDAPSSQCLPTAKLSELPGLPAVLRNPSDPVGSSSKQRRQCRCGECGKAFLHSYSCAALRSMRLCTQTTSPSCAPSVAKATAPRKASKLTRWAIAECAPSLVHSVTSESIRWFIQVLDPLCVSCGKAFARRPSLWLHRKTHQVLGVPSPCPCSVCGRLLATQGSLRNHMRFHTGEKSYLCPHCDRTFCQRATSEDTCGCTQGSALTNAHTVPVLARSCPNCGTISSPTQAKPTCAPCGKALRDPHTLRAHERLHSGDRPFRCPQCG